ncbi:MAG: SPOR domain-containing protein [Rikenellaceae bacterium]
MALFLLFVPFVWGAKRAVVVDEATLYQMLVDEADSLQSVENKLRKGLSEYRIGYKVGDEQLARQIEQTELQIFDTHQRRIDVQGRINEIEQRQELANIGTLRHVEEEESTAVNGVEIGGESVATISRSRVLAAALSSDDLESLREMDDLERELGELYDEALQGYMTLANLSQLYAQTKSETEARKYQGSFNKIVDDVESMFLDLEDDWGEVYDTKSYIYAVLLEVMGREDLLDVGENLLRNGAAGFMVDEDNPYCSAQLYQMQKSALLSYEGKIAQALALDLAVDSLGRASKSIAAKDGLSKLEYVEITERNFIEYENVKFSTKQRYKSSSQIPVAKSYSRGRIYRLQLGAFKSAQAPTLFRGAYPLSYDKTYGFWTYYTGGFATYAEAEKAQALCKSVGFKRPEIVVWNDGKRRNYTRTPLPATKGYRVIISGSDELPQSVTSLIPTMCGSGAKMSKLGGGRYIVATIGVKPKADEFAEAVEALSDDLKTEVVEVK